MSALAILGGKPAIPKSLDPYPSIGAAEQRAVFEVMQAGCLSGFYGSWREGFLGGPKVQELEAAWSERFSVKHAVSVNSNTSGLYAAIGAAGIGPGDEVIVPCTTMSATAMAPLIYGGIPVFADIDKGTFCIDLGSVQANLTDKTRAIIAVNLFGQAAPLKELRALCDARGIVLIEDNAQAPLATENGQYCGTIGHISVFSLNYHKHIHTGEGGICCTNDDHLAERLRMIRNHAEAVVGPAGVKDLCNMIGFNFRMTELSAAIGSVQLADADAHIGRREYLGGRLTEGISGLEGLTPPYVRPGCRHVYYLWVVRLDQARLGVSRSTFVEALEAEGVPCFPAYVAPIYQLPLFRDRIAIGREGYPFSLTDRIYNRGLCPVAEDLYEREIVAFETCAFDVDDDDIDRLVDAFRKVHAGCTTLAEWERKKAS